MLLLFLQEMSAASAQLDTVAQAVFGLAVCWALWSPYYAMQACLAALKHLVFEDWSVVQDAVAEEVSTLSAANQSGGTKLLCFLLHLS